LSVRAFRVVLIKPSHYDHDGYVIQWLRSTLPSNSLASAYGLIKQCARDRVLGPDVDVEIEACDECNTIVDVRPRRGASAPPAAAWSAWSAFSRINIRARSISGGNFALSACR
jgi:hypothetical protein